MYTCVLLLCVCGDVVLVCGWVRLYSRVLSCIMGIAHGVRVFICYVCGWDVWGGCVPNMLCRWVIHNVVHCVCEIECVSYVFDVVVWLYVLNMC